MIFFLWCSCTFAAAYMDYSPEKGALIMLLLECVFMMLASISYEKMKKRVKRLEEQNNAYLDLWKRRLEVNDNVDGKRKRCGGK